MARYNREFLVPYLRDVCALHLAQDKLECRKNALNSEILTLKLRTQGGHKPVRPSKPDSPSLTLLAGIGIFTMVMGLLPLSLGESFWMMVCMIIGGILLGPALYMKKQENDEYDWRLQQFYTELNKFNAEVKDAETALQSRLPYIQQEINQCKYELKTINAVIQRVYSANVIPMQYREMYAAVYLYDWFRSSAADDIDMALNMFVLEEIKDRLDTIIRNQAQIILNQEMILANQQKSIEDQRRNSDMMRTKLNQIAAGNDERNRYMKMIEGNTAAIAYFAAADYIRNI